MLGVASSSIAIRFVVVQKVSCKANATSYKHGAIFHCACDDGRMGDSVKKNLEVISKVGYLCFPAFVLFVCRVAFQHNNHVYNVQAKYVERV